MFDHALMANKIGEISAKNVSEIISSEGPNIPSNSRNSA